MANIYKPPHSNFWLQIVGIYITVAAVLFLTPVSKELSAEDFHVNSTDDLPDVSPGDGFCSTGRMVGDEPERTLRAAIMEANALPGPDTVYVPAGIYYLTLRDPLLPDETPEVLRSITSLLPAEVAYFCSANDLDIAGQTKLIGAGRGQTIIDGLFLLNDRVLHVHGASTISNLTIRNGVTPGYGGGIYSDRAEYLIIEDVDIEMCNAKMGGGIAIRSGGTWDVNVARCKIFGNSAESGGGVYIDSIGHYRIIFDEVWIDYNSVRSSSTSAPFGRGGGIYLNMKNNRLGGPHRNITIVNKSTVSRNTAGVAGGIFNNSSNLLLLNSTISENDGGGLVNHWDFTKTDHPSVVQMRLCSVVHNGNGYGVKIDDRLPFQFGHSIISGNRIRSGSPRHHELGGVPADLFVSVRSEAPALLVRSLGSNIVWPDTDRFDRLKTTSDLTVDPRINRRLEDHGGFAPMHSLRFDSPAINAGTTDVAGMLRSISTHLAATTIYPATLTDQRGVLRPVGGVVDIGAFEDLRDRIYDWHRPIRSDNLKPKEFENRFDFELKLDELREMEGDTDEEDGKSDEEMNFQVWKK